MNDTLDNNLSNENDKLQQSENPAESAEKKEINEEVKATEAMPAEAVSAEPVQPAAPTSESTESTEPAPAEKTADEPVEAKAVDEPAPQPEAKSDEPVQQPAAATEGSPSAETPSQEEPTEEKQPIDLSKLSKEEILDKLEETTNDVLNVSRSYFEALKQAYYKLRHTEIETAKAAFLEAGNEEKDFIAPVDANEGRMKELMNAYKEKRAEAVAEEDKQKEANYALKQQLIEKLKTLSESQDDFNKLYQEFKDIQQRWKEVKAVPQEKASELWKDYQLYSEKFYDIIKINNQFRDYDFKKNLELKTALCETVEKLCEEPDVISAFHQLQKLHQQWREIGPVAKDLREDLWTRFKTASTMINKRHQQHFEELKGKEQENLTAKSGICDEVDAINTTTGEIKSFKDWEDKSKQVIDLQQKWKTIGYAPKKDNVKIFERFRAACDLFFNAKSEFYKAIKAEMDVNLAKKRALCEQAEALKDSTEWKESGDKLIEIQKEWKTIGPVARKHSDSIWKRFITACDYFFEQKNKNVVSQKTIEQNNLAAKRALIDKVNALDPDMEPGEAISTLKGFQSEWQGIGFVPFKEKDKVFKEFHDAVDKQFDRLKVGQSDRRVQSYRRNISDKVENEGDGAKGKLFGDREKLMRAYERMKSDLQTYENNIGFFNVSSKGGGSLVKEMENKIAKLKADMQETEKKIQAIDENI